MKIQRYRPFSAQADDIVLKNILRREYLQNKRLRDIEVSIVLPTFNRSKVIGNAITSVKNQLHQKWQLYICDDGSTDNTNEIYSDHKKDNRISILKLPHKGVSHARNAGIKKSKSQYIAFLDSDNTWDPEYLSLMISFIEKFCLDSGYCAAHLIGDDIDQWLGDHFSWQACVVQNYIDLNCFMIKSTNKEYYFDESLQRFVDWDYILGATRSSRTSFLPLALIKYCDSKLRPRITTTIYQNNEKDAKIASIKEKHLALMGSNENIDARMIKGNETQE